MNNSNIKKLNLVILISIIILITPILTLANAAKPIENPMDQTILFDNNSGIGLVEETVSLIFSEGKYYRAKVEIEYNLVNLTDVDQSFDLLFITPNLEDSDFHVMLNDEKVEEIINKKDIVRPKNWYMSKTTTITEPISKKELGKTPEKYGREYNNVINGATFPISIKSKESVKLYINYQSDSGFYRYGDVINTVYSQLYYLTPAKFWDGEAKVNLRVEFPKDSNVEMFSNIPMNKTRDHIYETTLNEIPDKEWLFSFADRKGLFFGTNNRSLHNVNIIIIIALLIIIAITIKRKKHKRIITYLLYLIILALILNIKLSYSSMFFFMVFVVYNPLFYMLLIYIFIIKTRKRTKL